MTRIVELRPLFVEAANTEFLFVNGIWEAGEQTERLAHEKGHSYYRWPHGGVSTVEAVELIASADALVLAPTSIAPTGIQQPADGEEAGRIIGERLLDPVSADRPDLHLVLISHFLVGHGVTHRNTNTGTWGLRTLEARARAGRNPRTVLRHTWMSTIHDPSYQTRLSQDRFADGLVSNESLAAAVLTAIEHPAESVGRTAAIFNLSIPETGTTDLLAQFALLARDPEADFAEQAAHA
jgi:hypothetical protein